MRQWFRLDGVAAIETIAPLDLTSKAGRLGDAGVQTLQAVLHRPNVAACLVKLSLK